MIPGLISLCGVCGRQPLVMDIQNTDRSMDLSDFLYRLHNEKVRN